MQKPPEKAGIGRILKNSRRVLGRLKAHPKAKALAPKFQVVHDALKKANLAVVDCDDVAQDTGAAVDVCDALAREGVTDFQLGLLAVVRRDYKAAEYIGVFPDGFEAAKKLSGKALQQFLLAKVEHLATLDKASPLQAHAGPLKAAALAYFMPLADDDKAKAACTRAETAVAVARGRWMVEYDGLYGDVRSLFKGNRALAESFFVEWSRKSDKAAKAAAAADAAK